MNALAGHAFTKMNGLGNEIVVVDMRPGPTSVTTAEARAAARLLAFDQMMVLTAPRASEREAAVRIHNFDGSVAGACGNGMRGITALLCRETGKPTLTFETDAGLL